MATAVLRGANVVITAQETLSFETPVIYEQTYPASEVSYKRWINENGAKCLELRHNEQELMLLSESIGTRGFGNSIFGQTLVDLAAAQADIALGSSGGSSSSGSSTLPLGASTSVLQTAGNLSLTNIQTELVASNVSLDSLEVLQTASNASLDSLEILQTAFNTSLDSLEILQTASNTSLDSLETLQTATNTSLDNIETRIGTSTDLATATTVTGLLKRLVQLGTDDRQLTQMLVKESTNLERVIVRQTIYDENLGTFSTSFVDLDGSVLSPVATLPVVPVVDNGGIEIASFDYNVLTAGVGYAINQTLQQLHLIDTVAGTITATLWFNKDTQLTIAAPLPTHVQPTTDRIESLTVDLTALTGYQKFRITYVAKTASPGISINDLIEAEDTYRGGVLLSQEYTNINTGLAIAVGQAYPAWSPLDYEILLSNTEATQLAVDATNVNTAPYVNIVDSSAGLAAVVSAGGVAVSGNSNQIVVGLSPNSNKVQLTNGLIDASLLNSQPLTSSNALVTVASPNSSNFSSLDAGTLAIRASLSAGRFITTRPVLTNLQQHSLRLNTDGALITAPDVIGITRFGTTNPTADTVVPVGKKIFRVFITNGNTTTLFIQFHSSATPLVTGSVPTAGFILRVPANSTSGWNEKDFGSSGELFTNLRIGISTTFVNFTAPSAAQLLLTSLSVKHES